MQFRLFISRSGDEESENLNKLSKVTWPSSIQVSYGIQASQSLLFIYVNNRSKKGPVIYGLCALFGHTTKYILKSSSDTSVATSLTLSTGLLARPTMCMLYLRHRLL